MKTATGVRQSQKNLENNKYRTLSKEKQEKKKDKRVRNEMRRRFEASKETCPASGSVADSPPGIKGEMHRLRGP